MYSLVVLLSMLATSLFLRAYTADERPARRWPVLFGLVARGRRSTPTTGRSSSAWRCASRGSGCSALAPAAERRARLRDGALGFGLTALLYLPWVPTLLFQAAHTGAPWSRQPGYEDLTMEATHRLLGHTAWLVLVVAAGGGVVALVRAGRGRRLTRRRAAPCSRSGSWRVGTVLLAYGGLAVLARRGRCATSRSPSRPFLLLCAAGLAAARGVGLLALVDRRDPVGLRRAGRRRKSNVRQVATAIAPSLSPGDVVVSTQPEQMPVLHHYLPDGLRYATLTGYVHGRRRHRLARRRRPPASRPPRSATSSRSSTSSRPAAGSSSSRRSSSTMAPLARAVDQARAAALGGVQPVRHQRPRASARRRSTRRCRDKRGPNPVTATVLVKTER